ncbi:fatty acyl-CoA reductase wat [Trichonephila clavipes]|nr:fatty acyl-CoA reductase wat [Trichonephila clavipes]
MSETEKAQMAEIRAARGRVKASLTRLENTFDEINTRNEISIRLSRLDDLFKEFERLDSNLSLEESELQEFEERIFYLNAKFNDKLDELNVQNQGRTQNSVASSITSNSNVSNFRLPKLSIPQFNGHFKDWINFKDLFVSTVHSQVSISNVEKFQYLKGLLTNEPASLIKHMPISNDSYEEAWQKFVRKGNETSQREGASAETRNEASEFKGQAGESEIYSGASVNSELNLSFLPTAKVKIFYNNNSNESFICRALLDSGSECCFISERVVNILGLKEKAVKFLFVGSRGLLQVKLKAALIWLSDHSLRMSVWK